MDNAVWRDITQIRSQAPMVMNITNYVVMNTTANALLAIGASPVMAHAIDEVEHMVGLADALVINIGTLSAPWVEAMFAAGRRARQLGVPIVLDPVGCGATPYRTDTACRLVEQVRPTVIRGNASEIKALQGTAATTRGVDSRHSSDEAQADALALADRAGCVVAVSGAVDLIVSATRLARVANGHALMTRVTGMGCTSTALLAAFLAVDTDAFDAATHAAVTMGVAGEVAAARARGPGSFQPEFLDSLHALDDATLGRLTRLTLLPR